MTVAAGVGLALVAAGIVGDSAISVALLRGPLLWPLLLHPVAVIAWALGTRIARRRSDVSTALLALGLFPGLGPLGITLGLAAGWMMERRTGVALPTLDHHRPADTPRATEEHDAPSPAPAANGSRSKRDAIRRVRNGNREAVSWLREHLRDPDPDVRNEAAVTLSRLDAKTHGRIDAALETVRTTPACAQSHADLADLCRDYARSGLVGDVNAQFYLRRARAAMLEASRLEPERADLSRTLVHIEAEMDSSRR